MKILKEIKSDYKIINIVILCICILILWLPKVLQILEYVSPVFVKCSYLQLTGKPCPLCGGTRFIKNIGSAINNPSYFLNFFGVIIIIIIMEIIFRTINIIKKEYKESVIKIDIILHIIIFITYVSYEIWFIKYKW